jgi:pimeloyl-ACP methyl ester carboxylesterase
MAAARGARRASPVPPLARPDTGAGDRQPGDAKAQQREPAAWRRDEIVAEAYTSAGLLRHAWEGFIRPQSDIRRLMPQLRCPVLFAWAKDDRAVAWSRSRKAALSTPDHTVALLPGGHAAFLEAPEAFDAALLAFVDAKVRARAAA